MHPNSDTPILPYYHPTTACFIDDNEPFLESHRQRLPADCAYQTFSSPTRALDHINSLSSSTSLADKCVIPAELGETNISVNLHVLEREVARKERFSDISAILVDYAMPGMNGIEFCQKIQNKDLQVALLTADADETIAIDALNSGLISRYIRKGDVEIWNNLEGVIRQMQEKYFLDSSASLFMNRSQSPIAFRNIPQLRTYFKHALQAEKIVEYYLVANPMGYLMLRSDGRLCRMVIFDNIERQQQIEIAQRFKAPRAIIEQLTAHTHVCYFSEHPADYLNEIYPWHETILPVQKFERRRGDGQVAESWFAGIAEYPPVDIDFDVSTCSYNAYLARQIV